MTRSTWKREERIVADLFGGKRIPVLGGSDMDVDAPGFGISVKQRRKLPAWIKDAVQQIEGAARPEQLPIVVLTESATGQRYVLLGLDVFRQWYV